MDAGAGMKMDSVPVIKRGTPAWLDFDLSLRSRRILFSIVAVVALFSLWLHFSCAPGGECACVISRARPRIGVVG